MRATKPSTLVLTALVAAVFGWLLVSRFYGELPQLPWLPAVTMLLLAIAEGMTARATKARIDRQPGTQPVEPLVVARLVALAKASSLAGALLGGVYAGLTVWVFLQRDRLAAASDDVPVAAAGVLAGALLVAAALWLEYACRIPSRDDDDYESGRGDDSGGQARSGL
jgi:Protein of unknown function (DUF3180)